MCPMSEPLERERHMGRFGTGASTDACTVSPPWPATGERATWFVIAVLLAAMALVRVHAANGPSGILANALALALFALFYVLIRIREAGGRV